MNNATIKIALTNLGKYNEGELVYTWLELPATDEEISAAFTEIGVAPHTEYEEHFISDYEAPFQIGEYESIRKLNEIAEQLEGVDVPESSKYGIYEVEDVIAFAHQIEDAGLIRDATEYVGDIISDETLDEMVRGMIENGDGWLRVKLFLQNADNLADYHLLDGYANVTRLDNGVLERVISDLMDEVRRELR